MTLDINLDPLWGGGGVFWGQQLLWGGQGDILGHSLASLCLVCLPQLGRGSSVSPPKIRVRKLQEMSLWALRNGSYLTGWVYNFSRMGLKGPSLLLHVSFRSGGSFLNRRVHTRHLGQPVSSLPAPGVGPSDTQAWHMCSSNSGSFPEQGPPSPLRSRDPGLLPASWVHQYPTPSVGLSGGFNTCRIPRISVGGWTQDEPHLGKFQFPPGSRITMSYSVAYQMGLGCGPSLLPCLLVREGPCWVGVRAVSARVAWVTYIPMVMPLGISAVVLLWQKAKSLPLKPSFLPAVPSAVFFHLLLWLWYRFK